MKILIVNDDGIRAKGLTTLAARFSKNHQVTVVAPDIECSGESHRVNFIRPIACREVNAIDGCDCYMVHGSPCDCTKFGAEYILADKPDLVLSGINNGENVGTDLVYSGTVNAAIEASIIGIRAIAISVAGRKNEYDYCCDFLESNLEQLMQLAPDFRTVININFPSGDKGDIRGVKVCAVGERVFKDAYQIVPNRYADYENSYLLTGAPIKASQLVAENDVQLLEAGYITISPVVAQYTDNRVLEIIKGSQFKV